MTAPNPPVDFRSGEEKKIWQEYQDFITSLDKEYFSLAWLSTTISSKNQFLSSLYQHIRSGEPYEYSPPFPAWKRALIMMIDLWNCCTAFIRYHRTFTLKHIPDNATVIYSWTMNRSFANGTYSDIYFSDLIPFLAKTEHIVLVVRMLENEPGTWHRLKELSNDRITFLPFQYFISPWDMLCALCWSFFKRPRIRKARFRGQDVTRLINTEIRENYHNEELRSNYLNHRVAGTIAKALHPKKFIYTFENHSWEKAAIMAFRHYSPHTFIIGYEHTQTPLKQFNFFPGSEAETFMPYPDRLCTTGPETARILHTYGHYPPGIIQPSCALRHTYLKGIDPRQRTHHNACVALFSIGFTETDTLFRLMTEAFKTSDTTVYVRFHPLMNGEKYLRLSGGSLPQNFVLADKEPLNEILNKIDYAIYAETSVCVDALIMGIPVLFADVDRFYSTDAIFANVHFKKTFSTVQELTSAVQQIKAWDDVTYYDEQKKALAYARSYVAPVTDTALHAFI